MKEKTIDKKIMTYASATLILLVIAVVLRTVCLFVSFDAYIGYYKDGFLTTVLNTFLLLSALCFVSAFFTVKQDVSCSDGREKNTALKVASLLPAVALSYNVALAVSDVRTLTVFTAIISLAAILSIISFFAKIFDLKGNTTHALLGFAVIIYCVAAVVNSYFDAYELFNGPNKIMMHLALLSVALFMLAEIRAYADKLKKGYYVATLCAATFFCGVCAIPTLIFYISSEFTNNYLVYHWVIAGFFAYLIVRLFSFVLSSAAADEETEAEVSAE